MSPARGAHCEHGTTADTAIFIGIARRVRTGVVALAARQEALSAERREARVHEAADDVVVRLVRAAAAEAEDGEAEAGERRVLLAQPVHERARAVRRVALTEAREQQRDARLLLRAHTAAATQTLVSASRRRR